MSILSLLHVYVCVEGRLARTGWKIRLQAEIVILWMKVIKSNQIKSDQLFNNGIFIQLKDQIMMKVFPHPKHMFHCLVIIAEDF